MPYNIHTHTPKHTHNTHTRSGGGDTRLEVLVGCDFGGDEAFIEPEGRVEVKDQRHCQK